MRPNPQKTADLVTFTEEIFNGKFHFLCSAIYMAWYCKDTSFSWYYFLMSPVSLKTIRCCNMQAGIHYFQVYCYIKTFKVFLNTETVRAINSKWYQSLPLKNLVKRREHRRHIWRQVIQGLSGKAKRVSWFYVNYVKYIYNRIPQKHHGTSD